MSQLYRMVAASLGVLVALTVAATTHSEQFILNRVFDFDNSALRVTGVGGASLVTGPAGGGTEDTLPQFDGDGNLVDSLISCDGTNCTPAADGTADLGSHTKRFDEMFADASIGISNGAAFTSQLGDGFLSIPAGGTAASSGNVRLPVNAQVRSRNNANTGDLQLFSTNTTDALTMGGTTTAPATINIRSGGDINIQPDSNADGTNVVNFRNDAFGVVATVDEAGVADFSAYKDSGVAGSIVKTYPSDAAYDPASLGVGSSRTDSVTVTGVVANVAITCNPGTFGNFAACLYNCRASATNTVEVHWYNGDDGVGGSSCNPDSSTWQFMQPLS